MLPDSAKVSALTHKMQEPHLREVPSAHVLRLSHQPRGAPAGRGQQLGPLSCTRTQPFPLSASPAQDGATSAPPHWCGSPRGGPLLPHALCRPLPTRGPQGHLRPSDHDTPPQQPPTRME